VSRQNEGSFGFAKRWLLCRAKTKEPECAVGFRFPFFLYAAKIPLSFCRLFCLFTMNANVSVYAMFCGTQWSKIWESEVQRANRIYCVRRAERSDSGVRVQRALRIFEKFIHIIPFLVGFLLLYLIFLF
jgi:hypothetical protein